MLLTIVAGARPNFMKIAPIIRAINNAKTAGKPIDFRLVHTGQHYDKSMSGSFFEQLNIPEPHANLNCGGGAAAIAGAVGFGRVEAGWYSREMGWPCGGAHCRLVC